MMAAKRQILNVLDRFWGRGQVLMTILEDADVVLDTYSPNLPVPIQDVDINVLAGLGILQVRVNEGAAEIDLVKSKHCASSEWL